MSKVVFARNLSVMLKAGLPISEALIIIDEQATGRMKKVVAGLLASIQGGQSLSAAMERYPKVFSSMFINIVKAGEKSGTLEENLNYISIQLDKERELKSKITSAMIYPILVVSIAFALGLGVTFLVLPKITPLFEGLNVELPLSTKILIKFSNIVRYNTLAIFVGVLMVVIFCIWFFKSKTMRPISNYIYIKIPVIGRLVRNSNLAQFNRSLGTLLRSGLNIDEAIFVSRDTLSNYYYQKSLQHIALNVQKGLKLSEQLSLYPNLYPKLMCSMIRVGEETGKLEDTMFFLASLYETEVDNASKSLATMIEPILLVCIGLVVAFLALSIITPIYKITGSIQQ